MRSTGGCVSWYASDVVTEEVTKVAGPCGCLESTGLNGVVLVDQCTCALYV